MAHHYQKRWVFTWNAEDDGTLVNKESLIKLLNKITVEGVFQKEQGEKTARLHYQGRFNLKGSRLGKKRLLEIFGELGNVRNLTLEPEILYDSTKYCTKSETRVEGPYYVGTDAYRLRYQPEEIKLRMWQKQLLEEIKKIDATEQRDRKVIWVQDPNGRAGKSTFLRHLSFGQEDLNVKKLPLDKPDRLRMAICKIVKKENVDVFAFDFTRTRGKETAVEDLFEIVEEIKNAHVVSVMYGNPMEVTMISPHVIIFTNEKLEDYRDYLSEDRWQPYLISLGKELMHMEYDYTMKSYLYIPLENNKKAQVDKPEPTFRSINELEQKWMEAASNNPIDLDYD